ncbi:MAG: hypothetical protein Q7S56_03255 [Nanoarchaeota archaeon]|nr:hypothetical protein [Nanoarchaeota archaeon]
MSEKEFDIPNPEKLSLDELVSVWPVYHRNEVSVGNVDSPLAITTLWTERQPLAKRLDVSQYSAIGQCFSPRGVNLILRELLANPNIRRLVTWGRDPTNTGSMLNNFFNNGFNDDYTIKGIDKKVLILPEEIPLQEFDALRKNIKVHDLRENVREGDYESAATAIREISHSLSKDPWRDFGMRYPLGKETAETFPSEDMGYMIRGVTVEEVWLDILDNIIRFGKVKILEGEDSKKDTVGTFAIVTGNEDYKTLVKPEIFGRIPEFEKSVAKYVHQFTHGDPLEGSAYCYGEELFAHRADGQVINQIDYAVKKLSKKGGEHTGKAFATSYNVARHMNAPETPCLRGAHFMAISPDSDDSFKLHVINYFATHDMFEGWPANILGIRELQKLVLERVQPNFEQRGLSLELGSVSTISGSAHFYGGQLENAKKTLEEFPLIDNRTYTLHQASKLNQDPRGNYSISINQENNFYIEHLHPTSSAVLESETFSSVRQAQRWLAEKRVGDWLHMSYLGAELQKADTVRQLRKAGIQIEYKQDKPIDFSFLKN